MMTLSLESWSRVALRLALSSISSSRLLVRILCSSSNCSDLPLRSTNSAFETEIEESRLEIDTSAELISPSCFEILTSRSKTLCSIIEI